MNEPAQPPITPQVIQGYGNGGFTVSGMRYTGSIVVLRGQTLAWTPPDALSNLGLADFSPVTDEAAGVDIVLLGCGPRALPIAANLRAALRERGVTVEVMDSGAACRTFNLLQMEGRRVAAMLVAVA